MDEVKKNCKRPIIIATGILGFLLIVFGVVLLGLGISGFDYVTIGTIIAGVLLLLLLGVYHFLRNKRILCIVLAAVALYLVIAGIVALTSVIGYVLIGLGVVSVILTGLCFNCIDDR